jgi:hypothetical protein
MAKHVPFMECGACEEDVPLLPDNSMVVRFQFEPAYDYVLMQCPCGMWNRNFIDADTLVMLLSHKIPLVEEKYAPGEVHEAYCETRGIPLLAARELTRAEERLVEFFHYLLENEGIT